MIAIGGYNGIRDGCAPGNGNIVLLSLSIRFNWIRDRDRRIREFHAITGITYLPTFLLPRFISYYVQLKV